MIHNEINPAKNFTTERGDAVIIAPFYTSKAGFFIMQVWKKINGFRDYYEISNYGNIRSLHGLKVKLLHKTIGTNGYYMTALMSINGKRKNCTIHRLVAKAFILNPNNKPQINHIDGNKLNNYYKNIEWCTQSENMQHAFKNGLWESPKAMMGRPGILHPKSKAVLQYDMNNVFIKEYGSISEAFRNTGVDTSTICNVCMGKYKQAGGYIWKYSNSTT